MKFVGFQTITQSHLNILSHLSLLKWRSGSCPRPLVSLSRSAPGSRSSVTQRERLVGPPLVHSCSLLPLQAMSSCHNNKQCGPTCSVQRLPEREEGAEEKLHVGLNHSGLRGEDGDVSPSHLFVIRLLSYTSLYFAVCTFQLVCIQQTSP